MVSGKDLAVERFNMCWGNGLFVFCLVQPLTSQLLQEAHKYLAASLEGNILHDIDLAVVWGQSEMPVDPSPQVNVG